MKQRKHDSAVTLIELIVAIFLLGTVVLAGVAAELALRKMNVRPQDEIKLYHELIPILTKIKKDFQYMQIGTLTNSSFVNLTDASAVGFRMRVDTNENGKVDSADKWHAFRWLPSNKQFHYYPAYTGNPSDQYEIIGQSINDFSFSLEHFNTSLTVHLHAIKDASKPTDLIENPAINLTTTCYSRMVSSS